MSKVYYRGSVIGYLSASRCQQFSDRISFSALKTAKIGYVRNWELCFFRFSLLAETWR